MTETTTKVRMKVNYVLGAGSFQPGEVVELPASTATNLVKANLAEVVPTDKEELVQICKRLSDAGEHTGILTDDHSLKELAKKDGVNTADFPHHK